MTRECQVRICERLGVRLPGPTRHARLLSGAPAMLDLLAVLLLRWGEAVEADEAIDGAEAVAWLSPFTVEVRAALQAIVGLRSPETAP